MMSDTKTEIIILQESLVQSVASDAVTIGMLFVLPWFNHNYAGGSGWIFACIAAAWFVMLTSRMSGKKKSCTYTLEQARAKLDEMARDNA